MKHTKHLRVKGEAIVTLPSREKIYKTTMNKIKMLPFGTTIEYNSPPYFPDTDEEFDKKMKLLNSPKGKKLIKELLSNTALSHEK